MAERKHNRVLILILSILLLASCSMDLFANGRSETSSATESSTSSTYSSTTTYSSNITTVLDAENLYPATYNEKDYTVWQTYDFGTEYMFDVSSKTWVGDAPSEDVATVTVKAKNLKVKNLTDNPISIRLTGTNETFKVTIEGNGQAVKVTLDNLNLVSTDRCLNIKDSAVSYIVLEGESSLETLIDSEDKNVLKSAANLILDGTGSLSVTANSKNGIVSDHVVCILNGDITVTVAETTRYTDGDTTVEDKGTAIKPLLGFVMLDGNLTIYGNNSTKGYESKGIKVDGFEADTLDDESEAAGMGWIVIDGGTITIKTQGKAISAGWKSSEDDKPASSANYPVPNVYINGGTFDITTYATPRDDTKTLEGVSPEGIEAKNNLYITGGNLVINTTDDCLNASNSIYISGGLIYAYASQNDAIDAGAEENQGAFCISGGIVVAMGAGAPEGGLDCNSNARFQYTGGIIIGMGGSNNVPQASGTTAYIAGTSGASAGTTYALVQNGEVILAFKVPSGYRYASSVILGSAELVQGSASLVSGATVTAENTFNGMVYYGNVSVKGGNATDVTVSNTQSGGMGGFGFPGGGQQGGPGGRPGGKW
ncbi:MAG: carbohydrate-binding domain-containing protein [Spirochaetales bacterium]|nr:carbohydrate-binding domain-containing protein [Spirochaetales bacterium]